LLVHTILRRGKDFAFYLDALSEVYQQAYLYACGLEIIDELSTMSGMEFLYRLEFEDYFVLYNNVGNIVADQLVLVIDFDLFFVFGMEAGFFQFDQEGILVNGLEEAESEGVVDFVGAGYYFGG